MTSPNSPSSHPTASLATPEDSAGAASRSQVLADQHGGHWGEHPVHSKSAWQHEVVNDDTRLGYWDWVISRLDADEVIHAPSPFLWKVTISCVKVAKVIALDEEDAQDRAMRGCDAADRPVEWEETIESITVDSADFETD